MQSIVGVPAASSRGSPREIRNPFEGTCPTAVSVREPQKLNLLQQVMALWEEVPPYNMDMAALDPRPINPLAEGSKKIFMYNPAPARSRRGRSRSCSATSRRRSPTTASLSRTAGMSRRSPRLWRKRWSAPLAKPSPPTSNLLV